MVSNHSLGLLAKASAVPLELGLPSRLHVEPQSVGNRLKGMPYVRSVAVFLLVGLLHAGLLLKVLVLDKPVPPQAEAPTIEGVLIPAPRVVQEQPAPVIPVPPPPPVMPPPPKPQPVKTLPPKPNPVAKPMPKPAPAPIPRPAVEPVIAQPAVVQEAPVPVAVQAPRSAAQTVAPPHTEATGLRNPKPVYPPVSRRRGETGTVLLELLVLADGSVTNVRVSKSSGYPLLDRAALQAVKRWRYTPAKRGSVPVDYPYMQPVRFDLQR